MPKIPFIEARLDIGTERTDEIEHRLRLYLRNLRENRRLQERQAERREDRNGMPHFDAAPVDLTRDDYVRIHRRAKDLVRRRASVDRLSHLRKEDRAQLSGLRDGVTLRTVATEHRADELAAALQAEMPWMAPATERLWHALRRAARSHSRAFRIPPLILDGLPGIGKSVWARRLAEILGAPSTTVEATNENAGFGVAGVQRGWGSAAPGKPMQLILRTLIGNPIVIVDEIEKAGIVTSSDGGRHDLAAALLPLLEAGTARRWECPFFQVPFDMSWISWILTSNRQALLPEPLLSRCQLVRLPALTSADLKHFARHQAERRGLSGAGLEAILETVGRCGDRDRRLSLRTIIRMLDRAEILEARPILH